MIEVDELLKLYNLGLNIIPVSENKVASIKWSKYQTERIERSKVLRLDFKGVAFVCGAVSDIVVVDCDTDEAIEFIESRDWFVPTPVVVKTRKGKHYYYRCGNKYVKTRRYERGDIKIDLKAEKGIALCPPTKNYYWEKFTEDFKSIPIIPDIYIETLHPEDYANEASEFHFNSSESSDLERVLKLFSPALKIGEKRNFYVRQVVEVLEKLGFKIDRSKVGPMKSDKFHINGFALFDGRALRLYAASTNSFFFTLQVPVEYQIQIYKELTA